MEAKIQDLDSQSKIFLALKLRHPMVDEEIEREKRKRRQRERERNVNRDRESRMSNLVGNGDRFRT